MIFYRFNHYSIIIITIVVVVVVNNSNCLIQQQQSKNESIDLIKMWHQHNWQILNVYRLIIDKLPKDSGQCHDAIRLLLSDAQKQIPYAMKMIDSNGRLTNGLFEGNFLNLGQFDECIRVSSDNFSGKYCIINLLIPDQLIQLFSNASEIDSKMYRKIVGKLAICVPSICSQDEINNLVQVFSEILTPKLTILYTQCVEKTKTNQMVILLSIFLSICIVFVGLSIVATIYEQIIKTNLTAAKKSVKSGGSILVSYKKFGSQTVKTYKTDKTNGDENNNSDNTSTIKLQTQESEEESQQQQQQHRQQQSNTRIFTTEKSLLQAFSMKKNWQKIFEIERDSITIFHCLKCLGMFWIIGQHSLSFIWYWMNFSNQFEIKNQTYNVFDIILVNGTFSVDVFLFISGYLVLYSLVRSMSSDTTRWTNLWTFYVKRYLRMTPTMMFLIFFSVTVLPFWGHGPEWFTSTIMFDFWCRDKWYLNLFYLHNTIQTETMCLSHSWYSAVDMQLFIISPFLVKLLFKKRWAGLSLTFSLLIASIVITATLTYLNEFPAVPYFNDEIEMATTNAYFKHVYIKTYCRAGPYLIGLLLAYSLTTTNRRNIRLSKKTLSVGWIFAAFATYGIILCMLPAQNRSIPSKTISATYSALSRNVFALGLAWISFVSITTEQQQQQQGGYFQRFVSYPLWTPLSRMSYCAYLLNPIIIAIFYGSRNHTFVYTPYLLFYLTMGNLIVTYFFSFLIALFIEYPIISLTKILLQHFYH